MKILCVDFDGVIHSYISGWKGVERVDDPPTPGAMQFLLDAMEHFDVCIYSSRSKERIGIEAMKSAIHRWYCEDLGFDGDDADDFMARLSFPTQKPAAFLTIDDRCIRFDGHFPDPEVLTKFKPWNVSNA